MDWNSEQYLMFKAERTQPAVDLANRITTVHPRKILDIGCGPGNSTEVLYKKYPNAYILGVDKSEEMIKTARINYPNLDFKICDASKDLFQLDKDFDIVFSNACIQWVPDHKHLIRNMLNLLNENGVLAVQIPMNDNEPIQKAIYELVTSDKWRSYFKEPRIFYTLSQSEYYDLLSEASEKFFIWETVYYHVMKSHNDILEWYRGTGLRPYLHVLPDDKKEIFERELMENLIQRYPKQKNNDIIFKFPRFFFIAYTKK
ncbi:MAG: methyltransferase domain-containing protein [Clostridiaceae bacterium]|jgi:trans-aconitate 2-methyltransferase|nr:methyltransferase domain-containing protein [Clostridiaceae bacterium]